MGERTWRQKKIKYIKVEDIKKVLMEDRHKSVNWSGGSGAIKLILRKLYL